MEKREPIKRMSTQNRGKLCTWRDAITYQYSLLPASLLLCQEHRLITRSDINDAIAHFVEETLSPRRAAAQSLRTERTRRRGGLYLAAHNRHRWGHYGRYAEVAPRKWRSALRFLKQNITFSLSDPVFAE